MNEIKIGSIKLSEKYKPIFVAEISANHNQSFVLAKKMLNSVKRSGADLLKLQLYEPLDMTLNLKNKEFIIKDTKSPWYKKSLFDLYKKSCTKKDLFIKIYKYAKKIKLPCFTSVFDTDSVEFLEKLKIPAYKISSFEINHIPLIEKVSKTKKPIIFSTGVATYSEIYEAIKICKKNNNNKIILLHCSSEYPAELKNCNLNHIKTLQKKFNCLIGFSDHTLGLAAPLSAISQGAVLIEKHFKLNKKGNYIDKDFSLTSSDFRHMVTIGKSMKDTLGRKTFSRNKSTNYNSKFKRSIYISKDTQKGEKLSEKNISIIRADKGIHPRNYIKVLNKRFTYNLKAGKPLLKKYYK